MPGIAGFISSTFDRDSQVVLRRMVECMKHEPFYTSGVLEQRQLGLAAGWVSHKGSFADCLPVWNETKDICLLFAGEHFVEPDTVLGLKQKGHECQGDDARCLVHLYEELGPKFVNRLNGVFSGLIVDLRARTILLFNDRYGLGRIYLHENKNGFFFASEAKSLLKVLPELRQVEMTSLGEFFSCGCALQGRTLFAGVSLLPGGSLWKFSAGGLVEKVSYFNRDGWDKQMELPASGYYESMARTFSQLLPRYFRGKQSVGLSLTGGIDSRMIIASLMPPPSTVPCYTFGGMYRDCADVKLARSIAKLCQQSFEVIPVTKQVFSEFPSLARRAVYYTDGAMDVTGAVELFANRRAREIAPVRMTGNYGSEILRGNVAFKPMPISRSIFSPDFVPIFDAAAVTYGHERNGSRTGFIAFKQVPWFHYARMALEQSQLTIRSPYLDNELVQLAFRAPGDIAVNKEMAFRFIAEKSRALSEILSDRGAPMQPGRPAGKFKLFCQEFLPRVEYICDYGMPQWFAKLNRLSGPLRLDRVFLGRQKFYHFRTWYRHELAPHVREVLLDPRSLSRAYLDRTQVEAMVSAHTTGKGNYTLEIHKLLSCELLQRSLIEQN